jgi:4,5-DOPA dioxygenase extradiol
MQPRPPALFLSHGAPDLLLSDGPAVQVFRDLPGRLPRPRAIVVCSAHWTADPVGVTGGGPLATIHDFGGFPEPLYAELYPARGDALLSAEIGRLLDGAGVGHRLHDGRGLDHGAWVPLKLMFPAAEIPVAQVSLPAGDLADCARLGAALAPLRQDGVLVVGSGGSVHNLRALRAGGAPDDWAQGFEVWLKETVERNAFDRLLAAATAAPGLRLAHPTLEHLAPLAVAWAAGGQDRPGRRIAEGFTYGNIGMSCFAFGEPECFLE